MQLAEVTINGFFPHVFSFDPDGKWVDLTAVDGMEGVYLLRSNHPSLRDLDNHQVPPIQVLNHLTTPLGFTHWYPNERYLVTFALSLLELALYRWLNTTPENGKNRLYVNMVRLDLGTLHMILKREPKLPALLDQLSATAELNPAGFADTSYLFAWLYAVPRLVDAAMLQPADAILATPGMLQSLLTLQSYAQHAIYTLIEHRDIEPMTEPILAQVLEEQDHPLMEGPWSPHTPDVRAWDDSLTRLTLYKRDLATETAQPVEAPRAFPIDQASLRTPGLAPWEDTPAILETLLKAQPPNTTGRPQDGADRE